MKKQFLFVLACFVAVSCLSSCRVTTEVITKEYPVKVVQPHAPFIDENIEALNDRITQEIDRNAGVSAKVARVPLRFVNTFVDEFQGVSARNPYDRGRPYTRDEFKQEMLADALKGLTQPTYVRGEQYAETLRSPFLFKEEMLRGGATTTTTVSEAGMSLLAKNYFEFQNAIEEDLRQAEEYFNEGKFSEALELVDRVMDMDTSSQDGRALFERIIKAREEARLKREAELRERVANSERINQFLVEAKRYLAQNNYEEAMRIGQMALSVDGTNQKAREFVDAIELAQFEDRLQGSGTSSFEVLERMIYKHLMLYQQYTDEHLEDLAKKELQKITILESYRDKLGGVAEYK